MEGVPASIIQSAQNVKVKLLSIIRGVSTVKKGFWVGLKLVKCREKKKKKKVKNHNLACH